MLTPKKKSLLEELNSTFSASNLDMRGENAWGAAVRFLTMLDESVPDENDKRKLMNSWVRAIKDKDYSKFKKSLKRYNSQLNVKK